MGQMPFLIWDERGTGPVAQVGSGISMYTSQHGGEVDEESSRVCNAETFPGRVVLCP